MTIIYDIVIQSLISAYDVLFNIIYSMIETPVLSIMALSIVINLIVLPLYKKADDIQKEQQIKSEKMKYWVDFIKKNFKGDERFMMLSAYYKVEHYSPLFVLKEAVPLLLQVPFFIAAYKYISSLSFLDGESFGFVQNLLKPDNVIKVGSISLNILPILMTIVNLLSGIIYLEKSTINQKIQVYGTSVIFLVLLYNSPSILVIYWLMNNVFALFKNMYIKYEGKLKNPLKICVSLFLIMFVSVGIISGIIDSKTDRLVAEVLVLIAVLNLMIFVVKLYASEHPEEVDGLLKSRLIKIFIPVASNDREVFVRLLIAEVCLVVLLGFYIPSTVLVSSANEFVSKDMGGFYWDLISYPFTVYIGLILVWLNVIIFSKNRYGRYYSTAIVWGILGVALVNQFLFDPELGVLYTDLTFDSEISFDATRNIVNICVCIAIFLIVIFIIQKKSRILLSIGMPMIIVLAGMGVKNVIGIRKAISDTTIYQSDESRPIKLSKNGKNVVVMMLDRAIGGYIPFIFDEKKEFKEKYRGFTYYPNTVSFGTHTIFGSPGLFGGYEYIPFETNKREGILLKDKHNEALKMMPVLFEKNGFHVTVCDPPYANYKEIPDLSIYDDYPEIRAYNLEGKYSSNFGMKLKGDIHKRQRHNFLIYGIFRTVPLFMKEYIYDNGHYTAKETKNASFSGELIDTYSVLENLANITEVRDDDQNYFLMFQNSTPHNPTELNPPDYQIGNERININNAYEDKEFEGRTLKIRSYIEWGHYCINVSTYGEIAKWLDYLKDEGVYDNTRIILVADHGYYLEQFDDLIFDDKLDIESLNPLLMVKDFDSKEGWKTDTSFMTNADVPTLATDKIIENPINPFTGKKINSDYKNNEKLMLTDSDNWMVEDNEGYKFEVGDGNWWSVHDNIFDMNNWKKED